MPKIIMHQEKIKNPEEVLAICPFDAIEIAEKGQVAINAACKMCKICVKRGPEGAFEYYEEPAPTVDKSLWKGITIYVEHHESKIHPVTYELLGKAKELAAKINHPVNCLFI